MTLKLKLLAALIAASACLGAGYYLGHRPVKPVVTYLPGNVKLVEVPVDRLTEKVVTKHVTDKAEAAKLLAENAALKVSVSQLTESLASHHSTGSGPVVVTPVPDSGISNVHFQDWRLTFDAQGNQARYSLTQRFDALTTSGRTEQGKPFSLLKLYEIGPGETRTLIPTKTTVIVADQTRVHWYAGLHIQGGLLLSVRNGQGEVAGIAGVQWLGRGRTTQPGDTSLALLSPAVRLSSDGPEIGILPVSYNVGRRLKPFSNIWLSPAIFGSTAGISRIGVALTATF